MIVRLLLLAALCYGLYRGWKWLRAVPAGQRRRRYLQAVLVVLAAIVVALAITGRVHWLGAVAVAALPVLQRLIGLLLRFSPLAMPWLRRKYHEWSAADGGSARSTQGGSGDRPRRPDGALTRSEALAILGLSEQADRDQVLQAHRRLIQKLHPDRGGSDYLAARINAAKEKLLERTG